MVDRADDVRPLTSTRVAQRLQRDEARIGRDADDTDPVVGIGGRDTRHVRAVAVAILWRAGRIAVLAETDIEICDEIGVIEVDARVDDRDAYS